jgi:hypothetical protein
MSMQSRIFNPPSTPKAILPGALASATGSVRTKTLGAKMLPTISIPTLTALPLWVHIAPPFLSGFVNS